MFHYTVRYIFILISFTSSIVVCGQTWNFSIGANSTNYVYTNSQGINPPYFQPASGLNIAIGYENSIFSHLNYDLGVSFSQYNSNGSVQNIPFSYHTDFIGLSGGIGPKFQLKNNFSISLKSNVSIQKMTFGSQFLQNHFVDLSNDEQFSSLRPFLGFSLELEKKVNPDLYVFAQFQHLDTMYFGKSNLNFVPTIFILGFKILSN